MKGAHDLVGAAWPGPQVRALRPDIGPVAPGRRRGEERRGRVAGWADRRRQRVGAEHRQGAQIGGPGDQIGADPAEACAIEQHHPALVGIASDRDHPLAADHPPDGQVFAPRPAAQVGVIGQHIVADRRPGSGRPLLGRQWPEIKDRAARDQHEGDDEKQGQPRPVGHVRSLFRPAGAPALRCMVSRDAFRSKSRWRGRQAAVSRSGFAAPGAAHPMIWPLWPLGLLAPGLLMSWPPPRHAIIASRVLLFLSVGGACA